MKDLYKVGIGMTAPTTDFPFGQIIDSSGSGAGATAGTMIKAKFVADLMYSFRKMFEVAGSTPNGDDENEANGYQMLNNLRLFIHYVLNENDDFELPLAQRIDEKIPISAADRVLTIYSPTDSAALKFTANIKDVYDNSVLYGYYQYDVSVATTILGRTVAKIGTFEYGDLVRCHFIDADNVNVERVFAANEIQSIEAQVTTNVAQILANIENISGLQDQVTDIDSFAQQNRVYAQQNSYAITQIDAYSPRCVLKMTKEDGVTTMTDTSAENIGRERLLFKVDSLITPTSGTNFLYKFNIMHRATTADDWEVCNLSNYNVVCPNLIVVYNNTTPHNSTSFVNNIGTSGEIIIESAGAAPTISSVSFSFSLIIY